MDDTKKHSGLLYREFERGHITRNEYDELSWKVIDSLLNQICILSEESKSIRDVSKLAKLSKKMLRIAKFLV